MQSINPSINQLINKTHSPTDSLSPRSAGWDRLPQSCQAFPPSAIRGPMHLTPNALVWVANVVCPTQPTTACHVYHYTSQRACPRPPTFPGQVS